MCPLALAYHINLIRRIFLVVSGELTYCYRSYLSLYLSLRVYVCDVPMAQ